MHVRYSSKLTRITVLAGFFWLGILLVMTMGDYVSRDWIKLPGAETCTQRGSLSRHWIKLP